MIAKEFAERARAAARDGRRLVAPLMGFPGLALTGSSIKLAQQNYGEHYRVLKALADRFEPDVIFPLMDLAVEANALGRYTVFPQHDSATVPKGHFDFKDLKRCAEINISFDNRLLGYVETVKLMSIGLPGQTMRGAYVIGPYSLAGLIMGADEAALATFDRPEELTVLLEFCTEKVQEYTRLLVAAGAQVLAILEPSSVMLGPQQFEQFSARYVRHITESTRYADVATVYHVCGNTMHLLEIMAGSGVDALSLDSPGAGVDLLAVARRVPQDVTIVGNICPTAAILNGTPRDVEREVVSLLKTMDPYPNFVLSTGCDLPQETPLDNIQAFMNAGRAYRVWG